MYAEAGGIEGAWKVCKEKQKGVCEVLTIKEVCKMLTISPWKVHDLVKQGLLKRHRIKGVSRRVLFDEKDVKALLVKEE